MTTLDGGENKRRSAKDVATAYVAAKDAARVATAFWLRWRCRYLGRMNADDRLDDCGVAALRAVREELGARRLQVPEVPKVPRT